MVLEILPLLSEESAQVSEPTVLDDDVQFASGNSLRTGAEQIDDVHVRAEVNENFQFANQRFDGAVGCVHMRTNHFDGNGCDLFFRLQTLCFCFDYSTKDARSQFIPFAVNQIKINIRRSLFLKIIIIDLPNLRRLIGNSHRLS